MKLEVLINDIAILEGSLPGFCNEKRTDTFMTFHFQGNQQIAEKLINPLGHSK